MKIFIFLLMLAGWGSCRAEGSCFRTATQAAVQVGEAEGGGYRLEFVRVDPFDGRAWAGVRSCLHPEWPVVMVAAPAAPHAAADKSSHAAATQAADVIAGAQVKVVQRDAMVRMQMSGTAMGSGRIGDRVWVRIAAPGDGNSRVELGLVQAAGELEIGQ